MNIVADANCFLAVVMDEPERAMIIGQTVGHHLIAPEVLPYEIGNALTAMVKRKVLAPDEVQDIWDATQDIAVDLREIDKKSALGIAVNCDIYAYDAYYLVCALETRSALLTLDKKMKRVAGELSITILEYQP
jgi:predicted nucleic acid-binding protein